MQGRHERAFVWRSRGSSMYNEGVAYLEVATMQILILIEPRDGGGFRATAGDPFRMSADAESEEAATQQLETMLRSRLKGTRIAVLDLGNGSTQDTKPLLKLDPIPGE